MKDNSYEFRYIESFSDLLKHTQCNANGQSVDMEKFMDMLTDISAGIQKNDGRIFLIGNGASAAFSNHMALDWSKNGKIRTYSLSDSAFLTALSNDYSYEEAFTEYLKIQKCSAEDLVVTISSSGNSRNIVNVLSFCSENGIPTVGLSGLKEDNKSRELSNYSLYVPAKTYGMVESAHQLLLHLWLDKFMNIFEWNRDSTQNMNSDEFTL